MKIDTLLSPQELPALAHRELSGTACVVFDILRATSTFVTALHHGAEAIIPVSEIAEAVALRQQQSDVLLAGERDGVRIRAAQSGGVDFDFGNSPREFTPDKVRGKTIVSTTTNGTRALRACGDAKMILAGSFLNLSATAKFLTKLQPEEVLLVCAGTGEGVALEDVLAAGALAELLADEQSDSTQVARQSFLRSKLDLAAAIASSTNGRRLFGIPELRADVAFCSQRDVFNLIALMDAGGSLRRM
ncbi:MAG TPA: 2-phosphosulfolactate phosphatase [bacterium]|nr:2-phosphosulfolactate phosphatase [bacterium]